MTDCTLRLCREIGVSGDEGRVRSVIETEARAFAHEIFTDTMGNLYVYKRGKSRGGKTIMLSAHMDEVGFIVTHIDDDGFLRFSAVGGVSTSILPGIRVLAGDARLPGVIGIKAVHLSGSDEKKKPPEIEDCYIDIGAKSRSDAEKYVSTGDYVSFYSENGVFGDWFIRARALDDRFGCAVMLELLRTELPADAWFVFTVQEEIGLCGAAVAAKRVSPDIAIVLECTTANDLPCVTGGERVCGLGKGPVVPFADRRTVYSERLIKLAAAAAADTEIPIQTKTAIAGGTDAGAISVSGRGCETLALSLPTRYLHSPVCVAKTSDMCDLYKLTLEVVRRL